MTITISNTSKITEVNGIPCRIWEGHTDTGVPVHCFITRIAVNEKEDTEQFEKELRQVSAPSADVAAYPLRIIL